MPTVKVTVSKAKAARLRALKAKGVKPRGNVGLNKTEKKQTKAIVESAIKKEHTLKYFDVDTTATANAPATSAQANTLKQISVIGYSSTTNENNAGETQSYGSQAFVPLFLARPFKENNPSSENAV
jgi:hypothetical protein